jgi:hypothetical protein
MNFRYKVGDKTFFVKLQAIREHNKTNLPIYFCTPDSYETVDFSKEPEQDLQDLLKEEAQRLRDSYKYIRMYFSGGSDSSQMLRTFMDNNIHIDEIVCWKSGLKVSDYEIENYAIPRLKKFAKELDGTKITISEPTREDYIKYWSEGITEEKIQNGCADFYTFIRLIQAPDLFKPENFKPGVLNLRGSDKPKIMNIKEHWYTYFLDVDLEPHSHCYHFFSDNALIQCKQAHLFLKNMKAHPRKREYEIYNFQKIWNESMDRYTDGESMENYPMKEMTIVEKKWSMPYKGGEVFYHNTKERKALEFLTQNDPEIVDLWLKCMDQYREITDNKWWNHNRPELSTVGVWSKFYCLTQKGNKTVDELYPDGFKQ